MVDHVIAEWPVRENERMQFHILRPTDRAGHVSVDGDDTVAGSVGLHGLDVGRSVFRVQPDFPFGLKNYGDSATAADADGVASAAGFGGFGIYPEERGDRRS